jgi:nucleotide-binding universal stress UspA family protein
MRKILVGVDLSPTSELAIATAIDLARRDGAEVILAMADAIPQIPEGLSERAAAAAKRQSSALAATLADDRRQLAALRERHAGQGATLSQLIVDGYPDEELPRVAREQGAELIVVGSHGRTGIKRVVMGSVAERCARLAECSVLVVRGSTPHGGFHRIVVGADFSPQGKVAIERAIAVAAPGATIDLVHCWQIPYVATGIDAPVLALPHGDMVAGWTDEGEALVRWTRQRTDRTVRFQLRSGAPALTLADAAAEANADLVVVGSHGRRGLRRFVLGSVAEVTARHAPCATLIAR